MSGLNDVRIVIPALDPDEKLYLLLDKLRQRGFLPPVLVNDGSSTKHQAYFQQARENYQCVVLEHNENLGKGCALKTAFSYIQKYLHDCQYVAAIDSDGQHEPEDVYACVMEAKKSENTGKVIFGCRDFSGREVPVKSKFGNQSMRVLMYSACGMSLSDTQTGLRVFPAELLESLSQVEGERFEYETNMLFFMQKEQIPYREIFIKTVYIEHNRTSHFRPVRDSVIIVKPFVKFMASSAASSVVDFGIFTLLFYLLKNMPKTTAIWAATIIARAVSAFCNYTLNRHKVFEQGSKKSPVKYTLLCLSQMCLSAALVSFAWHLTRGWAPLIKAAVDIGLFFASYQLQRQWVFHK